MALALEGKQEKEGINITQYMSPKGNTCRSQFQPSWTLNCLQLLQKFWIPYSREVNGLCGP